MYKPVLVLLLIGFTGLPGEVVAFERGNPLGEHGRYYGALLGCEDGYRNMGGQCRMPPSVMEVIVPGGTGLFVRDSNLLFQTLMKWAGQAKTMPATDSGGQRYNFIRACPEGYELKDWKCVRSSAAPPAKENPEIKTERPPAGGEKPFK